MKALPSCLSLISLFYSTLLCENKFTHHLQYKERFFFCQENISSYINCIKNKFEIFKVSCFFLLQLLSYDTRVQNQKLRCKLACSEFLILIPANCGKMSFVINIINTIIQRFTICIFIFRSALLTL